MLNYRLSAICFAAILTLAAPASFGNDIVDFLRAVNGVSRHHGHPGPYGRGIRHRRDIHHVGLRRSARFGRRPYNRSVSIHWGHGPQPIYSPLPVVAPPVAPLPHTLGQIVTCNVPLVHNVRVINPHEIAPGARPIVVAVRDPHLPAWGSHGCVERLVYVQVFAPCVPLRNMTVSPCRTHVTLDYGDWEICIHSCNGLVEVEYDD